MCNKFIEDNQANNSESDGSECLSDCDFQLSTSETFKFNKKDLMDLTKSMYLSKHNSLKLLICYCSDLSGLMEFVVGTYLSSEWLLFIDGSTKSLKSTLLRIHNSYPAKFFLVKSNVALEIKRNPVFKLLMYSMGSNFSPKMHYLFHILINW